MFHANPDEEKAITRKLSDLKSPHAALVDAFTIALEKNGLTVKKAFYSLSCIASDKDGFAASFAVKGKQLPIIEGFSHHFGFGTSFAGRIMLTVYVGGKDTKEGEFFVSSEIKSNRRKLEEADDLQEVADDLVQKYIEKAKILGKTIPRLRNKEVSARIADALILGVCRMKARWYNMNYSTLSVVDKHMEHCDSRTAWDLLMAISKGASKVKPTGGTMLRRKSATMILKKLLHKETSKIS